MTCFLSCLFFFFFNDPAPPEIYTLSLHDALPISLGQGRGARRPVCFWSRGPWQIPSGCSPPPSRSQSSCNGIDRKSTRLNSSHGYISYAVFCLKKKKKNTLILLSEIEKHHTNESD